MRLNFKKIASVLTSAVMLTSTIGFASAATYPEPFVEGGTANGAVVVGASAAVSDWTAAIDVQTNLNALVTESDSGATVTGGDSYEIQKASTKFHLGQGIRDITTVDLGEDHLPNLLADGKYWDADNDEKDYTQKITLANLTYQMFDDNDYKQDTPTVGIKISNGDNVLNYTLDFTDEPTWDDIDNTNFPFMGKEYYVLDTNYPTTNTSITLLDSAVTTILSEGETTSLEVNDKTYEVSISFIGSDSSVKLTVNGETTNSLDETSTNTYKLSDGAWIGIKDVMYTSKDTGISKVEFSIGAGKLILQNGVDVKLNDESISNLECAITAGATLPDVKIIWKADDELFITEDSEITMPGFESVKLSYAGMVKPASEEIKVEAGGDDYIVLKDFPLKDGNADINILYYNGSAYTMVGKDSDELLRTPGGTGILTWASTAVLRAAYMNNGSKNVGKQGANITFDGDTDSYFVASWNDTSNAESYLMRATSFALDSGRPEANIQYMKNGVWTDVKTGVYNGSVVTIGNVEFTIGPIEKTQEAVVINPTGTGVSFFKLYSKEGLWVSLPWINNTIKGVTIAGNHAGCYANLTGTGLTFRGQLGESLVCKNGSSTSTANNFPTTYYLIMQEEDKDGNKGVGGIINLTMTETSSNSYAQISDVAGGDDVSFAEEQETEIYRSFSYGEVATEMLWDKSGDQYSIKLIYPGDETYGEFFVSAPDATIIPGSSGAGGQILVVKDNEVSSVSGKDLFVVGGSCINSVAAKILGSETPLCEAAFTEKTGVGAGQYIIKVIASPYAAADSGKVAMLVAGYNAADTVDAVNKALEGVTSDVDTEQVY